MEGYWEHPAPEPDYDKHYCFVFNSAKVDAPSGYKFVGKYYGMGMKFMSKKVRKGKEKYAGWGKSLYIN
eukprot:1146711-Pelagomonas_calceolata.AAC.2